MVKVVAIQTLNTAIIGLSSISMRPKITLGSLVLAAALFAAGANADPFARQQDLSRRLQEQQFDLKMQRQSQQAPLILQQPQQERELQERLQQQEEALLDLYEQQRRELFHQPPPSEQQLQRERDAQALDFKLNNSR